ncbi:glycosyltransferase family 25 protein [Phreatobacter aquaticus]|uniref:Glycosyltransferase family 25 protein n=1 Tax=Phreatobacter aquaticus TaxID=2570229 RepID=A0A4D7QJV9_9HYPH|nr:glycosyltransferase family 25 protein [Phreatobacter aquaticus]QCK86253.1 glycosyltransferase family 25 protein [Phreatobacter aquaticus]
MPKRTWTERTLALVISLPRATARRIHARRLIDSLPMTGHLIDAVDGLGLTPDQRAAHQPDLFRPRYPFALGAAEIGCFLSHRAAWQALVASGHDQALILEDDAVLGPRFLPALDRLAAEREQWAFVQLHSHRSPERSPDTDFIGCRTLPQVEMVGQIVTRAAASRLIAASECFDRPVDSFIQLTWATGVPIHHLVRPVVANGGASLGGSTISRTMPALERIRRTAVRPLYKTSLRLRAEWHARRGPASGALGLGSLERA